MGLDLVKVYLLLGSNLGEREAYLNNSLKAIEERIGEIFSKSAIYETQAWGKIDKPIFLNIAVGVATHLSPLAVLENVLEIEALLGRVRHEKWGSRLIDIDIIFYGDEIINDGVKLIIPHPEMLKRKFVLEPLAEIAPDYLHPITNTNILEILTTLEDPLAVQKR